MASSGIFSRQKFMGVDLLLDVPFCVHVIAEKAGLKQKKITHTQSKNKPNPRKQKTAPVPECQLCFTPFVFAPQITHLQSADPPQLLAFLHATLPLSRVSTNALRHTLIIHDTLSSSSSPKNAIWRYMTLHSSGGWMFFLGILSILTCTHFFRYKHA